MNASTVSRQVKSLGIMRDAEGKFSFEAYVTARAAGLNPLHERGVESPALPSAAAVARGESDSPAPPRGGASALQSAHTAEKLWRAKSAQLTYEEKIGAVCERRGSVEAGMKTGEAIQDLLRDRRRRLAEELAPLTDVGAIETILVREDRVFVGNLEELMKRLLQVMEGERVEAA